MSRIFGVASSNNSPVFEIDNGGGIFIKDSESNELVNLQNKVEQIGNVWTFKTSNIFQIGSRAATSQINAIQVNGVNREFNDSLKEEVTDLLNKISEGKTQDRIEIISERPIRLVDYVINDVRNLNTYKVDVLGVIKNDDNIFIFQCLISNNLIVCETNFIIGSATTYMINNNNNLYDYLRHGNNDVILIVGVGPSGLADSTKEATLLATIHNGEVMYKDVINTKTLINNAIRESSSIFGKTYTFYNDSSKNNSKDLMNDFISQNRVVIYMMPYAGNSTDYDVYTFIGIHAEVICREALKNFTALMGDYIIKFAYNSTNDGFTLTKCKLTFT